MAADRKKTGYIMPFGIKKPEIKKPEIGGLDPELIAEIADMVMGIAESVIDGEDVKDIAKGIIEDKIKGAICDQVMGKIEPKLKGDIQKKLAEKAVEKAVDKAWEKIEEKIEEKKKKEE